MLTYIQSLLIGLAGAVTFYVGYSERELIGMALGIAVVLFGLGFAVLRERIV